MGLPNPHCVLQIASSIRPFVFPQNSVMALCRRTLPSKPEQGLSVVVADSESNSRICLPIGDIWGENPVALDLPVNNKRDELSCRGTGVCRRALPLVYRQAF